MTALKYSRLARITPSLVTYFDNVCKRINEMFDYKLLFSFAAHDETCDRLVIFRTFVILFSIVKQINDPKCGIQ
jgi:hypothetical protein